MRDTTLRPRLEGHEQTFLVELTELTGLRTEACPYRDHEVRMFLVYVLDELRTVGEVF